jgi:Dictyostelium (slime mold) repeat
MWGQNGVLPQCRVLTVLLCLLVMAARPVVGQNALTEIQQLTPPASAGFVDADQFAVVSGMNPNGTVIVSVSENQKGASTDTTGTFAVWLRNSTGLYEYVTSYNIITDVPTGQACGSGQTAVGNLFDGSYRIAIGCSASDGYVVLYDFTPPSTITYRTRFQRTSANDGVAMGRCVLMDETGETVVAAAYDTSTASAGFGTYFFYTRPSGTTTWTAKGNLKPVDTCDTGPVSTDEKTIAGFAGAMHPFTEELLTGGYTRDVAAANDNGGRYWIGDQGTGTPLYSCSGTEFDQATKVLGYGVNGVFVRNPYTARDMVFVWSYTSPGVWYHTRTDPSAAWSAELSTPSSNPAGGNIYRIEGCSGTTGVVVLTFDSRSDEGGASSGVVSVLYQQQGKLYNSLADEFDPTPAYASRYLGGGVGRSNGCADSVNRFVVGTKYASPNYGRLYVLQIDETVFFDPADPAEDPANCPYEGYPCTTNCSIDTVCVNVTGGWSCGNGTSTSSLCDDGDACTVDSCDPSVGCVYTDISSGCDDGINCTVDSCDPSVGCVYTANDSACDDGNSCTSDFCDVLDATPDECINDNVATGTPCAIFPDCVFGETCTAGICGGGTATDSLCDDGNMCTFDSCNDTVGCVYADLSGGCDDGVACTDDRCDPSIGCVYAANNSACQDTEPCTTLTYCDAVLDCSVGNMNNSFCNDGNACTTDTCSLVYGVGCEYTNISSSCDDSDACTADSCDNVTGCVYTDISSACDDNDACTADSCSPSTGCVYTDISSGCDDSDACTVDSCSPSTGCVYAALVCDDSDRCTVDRCDVSTGCVYTNASSCLPVLSTIQTLYSPVEAGFVAGDQFAEVTGLSPDGSALVTVSLYQAGTGSETTSTMVVWLQNATGQYAYAAAHNISDDIGSGGDCGNGQTAVSNLTGNTYRIAVGCAEWTTGKVVFYDYTLSGNITFRGYVNQTTSETESAFGTSVDMDNAGEFVVTGAIHTIGSINADKGTYFFYTRPSGATTWTARGDISPLDSCDTGPVIPSDLTFIGYSAVMHDETRELLVSGRLRDVVTAGDSLGRYWTLDQTGGIPYYVCSGTELLNPGTFVSYGQSGLWLQNPYTDADMILAFHLSRHPIDVYTRAYRSAGWTYSQRITSRTTTGLNMERVTGCNSVTGAAVVLFDARSNVTALNNGVVSLVYRRQNDIWYSDSDMVNPTPAYTGRYLGGGKSRGNACAHQANRFVYSARGVGINTTRLYVGLFNEAAIFDPTDPAADMSHCPYTGYPCVAYCYADSVCGVENGTWACVNGTSTDSLCDDGDVCTVDSCDSSVGCVYVNISSGCDDGNACTADSCDNVTGCVYTGINSLCDDGNVCTTDSCDLSIGCVYTNNLSPCDDGDACTDISACDAGVCTPTSTIICDDTLLCTVDSCDPSSGCVYTSISSLCDDSDACTTDVCDENNGGCVYTASGSLCDDGDACTVDSCDNVTGCVNVSIASSCDDGINCTVDSCDPSVGCVYMANDSACDDSDVCTADSCSPSTGCVYTDISSGCDDSDACTADSCDNVTGCVYTDISSGCDDSDVCTADSCSPSTGCVYTDISSGCDDSDACTVDSCSPSTGCVYAVSGSLCDDGDICTADSCNSSVGCVYVPVDCDDSINCTVDSCDSSVGCVYTLNHTACDDGIECTLITLCDATRDCDVAATTDSLCDDNNVCTSDFCSLVYGVGCVYTDISSGCDDFDPCTANSCDNVTGCVYASIGSLCDDGNACTIDTCVAFTGCVYAASGSLCDDGDACTADSCDSSNGCVYTSIASGCDDSINCTVDSCDSSTGCVYTASGSLCDDGDLCTTDSCDSSVGCVYTTIPGACDNSSVISVVQTLMPPPSMGFNGTACFGRVLAMSPNGSVLVSVSEFRAGSVVETTGTLMAWLRNSTGQYVYVASRELLLDLPSMQACGDGQAAVGSLFNGSYRIAVGCPTASTGVLVFYDFVPPATLLYRGQANQTEPYDGVSYGRFVTMDPTGELVVTAAGDTSPPPLSPAKPINGTYFFYGRSAGNTTWTAQGTSDPVDACDSGPMPLTDLTFAGLSGVLHPVTKELLTSGYGRDIATIGDNGGRYWIMDSTAGSPPYTCSGSEFDETPAVPLYGLSGMFMQTPYSDRDVMIAFDLASATFWSYERVSPGEPWSNGTVTTTTAITGSNIFRLAGCSSRTGAVVVLFATRSTIAATDNGVVSVAIQRQAGFSYSDPDIWNPSPAYAQRFLGGGLGRGNGCAYQANLFAASTCGSSLQAARVYIGRIDETVYFDPLDPAQDPADCPYVGYPCTNACQLDSVCINTTGTWLCGNGTTNTSVCNDGDACTTDTCSDSAVCVFSNSSSSCDDGNVCTDDSCDSSIGCVYTDISSGCDDGINCTVDSCDPLLGCVYTANDTACDDGFDCTLVTECHLTLDCIVTSVTYALCSDGDACTMDTCSFVYGVGCEFFSTASLCDDSDVCTVDSCSPSAGCVYTSTASLCDDGDACTADSCSPSTGCVYASTGSGCNDGNPCTDDSCDASSGCVYTDNTVACDDGDPCTLNDVCSGGVCSGVPKNCSDGDVCTGNTCEASSGACVPIYNAIPCDDGDACTLSDTCDNGTCVGVPKNCSDGNVCTDEVCSQPSGVCTATNNTVACDDGDPSTLGDVCEDGECAGIPAACDDGDNCTANGYDPSVGCVYAPIVCDDGVACTDDSCDAALGCVYRLNHTVCDDGAACTNDSCDATIGCTYTPVLCPPVTLSCTVPAPCSNATGCETQAAPAGTACNLTCVVVGEAVCENGTSRCVANGTAAALTLTNGQACGAPGWTCAGFVCVPPVTTPPVSAVGPAPSSLTFGVATLKLLTWLVLGTAALLGCCLLLLLILSRWSRRRCRPKPKTMEELSGIARRDVAAPKPKPWALSIGGDKD